MHDIVQILDLEGSNGSIGLLVEDTGNIDIKFLGILEESLKLADFERIVSPAEPQVIIKKNASRDFDLAAAHRIAARSETARIEAAEATTVTTTRIIGRNRSRSRRNRSGRIDQTRNNRDCPTILTLTSTRTRSTGIQTGTRTRAACRETGARAGTTGVQSGTRT